MKFFVFLLLPILAFAAPQEPEILVNNRILASVNGKNISVFDVMKKMEVFLYQAYPEEAQSAEKRYQFFNQSWRHALNELVKNELILADAEKLQLNIPDAKIRELIHERFGPNVMESLDSLGLTLDEAWQMIYTEIAVQQVSYFRVYKKSQDKIGPQDIKAAYVNYLTTNPPKEEWKYQVLSIRAKTEQLGSVYAQKAHALIRNEPLPFETLAKQLTESEEFDPNITINVSDDFNVEDKDLSTAHKSVLCSLATGAYSDPVPQVSRQDNSTVHRIFYLKDHKKSAPPSFDSMTEKLLDDLVQKEIDKELPPYLAKLRKQFNYNEQTVNSLPADFQPFSLR
ncbi:MAG: SurA N-terminal domain-containing protein [Simkaniaceae bacterium]|nr:SurA N-terminal domain-containing protein [Candidatus Sacchlamyda saccharinae]